MVFEGITKKRKQKSYELQKGDSTTTKNRVRKKVGGTSTIGKGKRNNTSFEEPRARRLSVIR